MTVAHWMLMLRVARRLALTSTVVATLPTFIASSSATVCCTFRRMPVVTDLSKPSFSTVTVYKPGRTYGCTKFPSEPLCTIC